MNVLENVFKNLRTPGEQSEWQDIGRWQRGRQWREAACRSDDEDPAISIAKLCQDPKTYRVLFLTVPPNFSAKKKNVVQPTRIFCTSRISWNRISDWLPIVFHFGTENWEEQLKKHPVQTCWPVSISKNILKISSIMK